MTGEDNIIFREKQKFGKFLRWLFLLEPFIFIGFVLLVISWQNQDSRPVPVFALILIIVVPFVITILFWLSELQTQVRKDGLYIRYIPFHIHFKRFAFEDFDRYYARQYSPIMEYGGWGIRYGFAGAGKAYNISGNKGLQIVFKNGKKLLIGSKNPDALVAAIDSIMKGIPQK